MIGTFEMELTDALDLDLSLVWDRINSPRANADGSVPEQESPDPANMSNRYPGRVHLVHGGPRGGELCCKSG